MGWTRWTLVNINRNFPPTLRAMVKVQICPISHFLNHLHPETQHHRRRLQHPPIPANYNHYHHHHKHLPTPLVPLKTTQSPKRTPNRTLPSRTPSSQPTTLPTHTHQFNSASPFHSLNNHPAARTLPSIPLLLPKQPSPTHSTPLHSKPSTSHHTTSPYPSTQDSLPDIPSSSFSPFLSLEAKVFNGAYTIQSSSPLATLYYILSSSRPRLILFFNSAR